MLFGGFRHKFYGTFCRSRSGEHIRVCPIPGNVLRKTPTPHGERRRRRRGAARRQTRVAQRTPGGTSHQPHAHTRRNEISRSGGKPPHSDKNPPTLGVLICPLWSLSSLCVPPLSRCLRCAFHRCPRCLLAQVPRCAKEPEKGILCRGPNLPRPPP